MDPAYLKLNDVQDIHISGLIDESVKVVVLLYTEE